ncbi:MAG: YceD family protein [Bacteroidota bacterium]
MDPLVEFSIPIKGIADGMHEYHYEIDGHFFEQFESSPVQQALIDLNVSLEKKPGLLVLHFDFTGKVNTTCDRCLADIYLPVTGSNRLLVKVSTETESEDPEVIYLHPEATKLKFANYAYEFMILSIPIIKVYDCEAEENPPCNNELLDRLFPEEEEDEAQESTNPIWEELKKFKNK